MWFAASAAPVISSSPVPLFPTISASRLSVRLSVCESVRQCEPRSVCVSVRLSVCVYLLACPSLHPFLLPSCLLPLRRTPSSLPHMEVYTQSGIYILKRLVRMPQWRGKLTRLARAPLSLPLSLPPSFSHRHLCAQVFEDCWGRTGASARLFIADIQTPHCQTRCPLTSTL